MAKTRIGLIGCGEYCSETHATFLTNKADVQITAISECVYPEELAQRQKQFNIPYAFSSYEEMLRNVELDGAVISTPHAYHYSQAKHCLKRGLHILIDKPPACHTEEIQELVQLADATGRHIVVASQRRYNPLFCFLHDEVQQGKLGELRFVSFQYERSIHPRFPTNWRNNPALSGGGVLLDAGYHIFDSLLWITGRRVTDVWGTLEHYQTHVETAASLVIELERNLLANISIHLGMPDHVVKEEVEVVGTKGVLLYQYLSLPGKPFSAHLNVMYAGHQTSTKVKRHKDSDFAPAKNLIDAIRGHGPVQSSGKDSIETIRTIEWIYQQLAPLNPEE